METRSEGPASVADAMAEVLVRHGVRFAFGIPGNDVLPLVRACERAGIRFVLARSEPAACFMADAQYQLTGAPGVVIAALGPGLANAISGIAGALMERSALLVLAGDVGGATAGIYNHQVFDHVALAAPVTKLALTLNPRRAAQMVARALDVATAHPAGPVLLNCPADATRAPAAAEPVFVPRRTLGATLGPAAEARARALLSGAGRPLALVGRGALDPRVAPALQNFLEAWGIPAFQSYKAKGTLDERHDLALGAVGLSPVIDPHAMALLRDADLVLPIGFDPIELRDAWLDAWPAATPTLTLDRGPQTHRIFPAGEEAVGDLAGILAALARDPAPAASWPAARLSACRDAVAAIVRPRAPAGAISPAALFDAIDRRMTPDWLLSVDVGAHRILANHVIRCRVPGQLLQSNGLCCMGYGLPAAIGAQLAHPDRPVVALVGDGCAMMSAGEIAVAAELGLPIVLVVLNDSALSLIKLKQEKMQLPAEGVDFGAHRFDLLAGMVGGVGRRVADLAGFEAALDAALGARRLTVIDAVVDPREYWEQM